MKKEIQLIELKDKIRKAEKEEDEMQSYFIGLIPSFLLCVGIAIFLYVKKQEIPEKYWIYIFSLFVGLSLIVLILIPFAYNWYSKTSKQLKELKKQEKGLKETL